uniref:NADH-ubiquinone oxidoreductase chain 2 n=1 Tax=Fopius arisanus TaxID=64838 RepID=A0A8F0F7M6_9HYME|nr:NADH dehydrogenase subunit 2 [Fopius arisanus]
MFYMKYNWLFIYMLIMNPLFLIFMNTYYSIWMFMEMNLLLFIVLLVLNNNYIGDKVMKYFLLNSFSSMIFFFFINLNMFIYNINFILVMNMMMMMKLGMFPFHIWFIDMLIQLNWIMCFILMVWQKIIPMFILMLIYNENFMLIFLILGGLFSLMMIFNQILLKKILGYSSINHMCWMFISLMINFNLFLIYYMSYFLINMVIVFMFWLFKLEEINSFYLIFINYNYKFYLFMLMLTLGGIPPMFGFFMKWLFIFEMGNLFNWLLVLLMIFYSLVFFYFYMRLIFNFMMLLYLKNNIILISNFLKKNNSYMFMMMNLFVTINLMLFFMW